MLVLSRKLLEKIYIGENVVLTVVAIDRGKIRLAITAPESVRVFRGEMLTDAQRSEIESRANENT